MPPAFTGAPLSRSAWTCSTVKVLFGTTKGDRPNATNSMIIDILAEIERVAGC